MLSIRRTLPVAILVLALLSACAGRPGGRGTAAIGPGAAGPGAAGPGASVPRVAGASAQAVVVRTDSWNATQGELQAYERSWTGAWKAVGGPVAVFVGRSGLGWGLGLQPRQADGPVKHEGDGRSPAGVFALTEAFGYAALTPPNPRFPFRVLTPQTVCVDDEVSTHYNTIFEAPEVPARDWDSFETMRRRDDRYSLGIVVAHNADRPEPGAGSCVFLHVRSEPPAPTPGCTTMPRPEVERLVRWLDAARKPVLVQLPRAEYERLREDWGLP